MDRITKLYDMFVNEYGEELEEAVELLSTLATEVPDASNEDIVDYAVNVIIDNDDLAPDDPESFLSDFVAQWGSKN
jgi:hypothetical protein